MQGHAGLRPNTEGKIKLLPSVNSNPHPQRSFICWIDGDSTTYFPLKCGVGLLSACWELAQRVQLVSPSDLKIVYTDKLRLLLSENWDFTSFEGDVWSHTSKGFWGWVDLGAVPMAEGDKLFPTRNRGARSITLWCVAWHVKNQETQGSCHMAAARYIFTA